ncbi:YcxB family protein [Priestia megaterium]
MMVTEDGLVEKSSKGEVKTPWSSITHIRETDEHLFILVSAMSGYVIPTSAFADVKALQHLKETLNAARAEKTS